MAKDKKNKGNKKNKGAGAKSGGQKQIFLIMGIMMGVVFLPSTVLLVAGMMPTWAVMFASRMRQRAKIVSVGSLNFAGCMPFLLELWGHGHTFDKSFSLLSEPMTIIVMYAAASIGYMIDWAISGLVSAMLFQKGISRQKAITKRKEELEERWGKEVTGTLMLDEDGFALPEEPEAVAPKAKS